MQRFGSAVLGVRLFGLGVVLGGGLLLGAPGCGDSDSHKPPPHECLRDSDCDDGLVCTYFNCVDPRGAGGPGSGGEGNGPDGGAGDGTGGRASSTGGSASSTGGSASSTGGRASSTGGRASSTGGSATITPTTNVALTTYPIRASALAASLGTGRFGSRIIATVPSDAPTHADSLVVIDPIAKNVVDTIPIGSDPSAIAMIFGGSTIWVGLRGDHALARIEQNGDIATYPLPLDPAGNETTVKSMTLYSRTTVLAALQSEGHYSGIVVLDDGVPRPKQVWAPVGPSFLTGGLAQHAFGFYDEGATYEFYDILVDDEGVTVTEVPSLSGSPKTEMEYSAEYIVTSHGEIINVKTPTAPLLEERRIEFQGLVSPDVSMDTVFMFTGTDATLRSLEFRSALRRWYGTPRRVPWSSAHHLVRPLQYFLAFADDEGEGTINQIEITDPTSF